MHPIYWIKSASIPAQPPTHWSYSALRAWRKCPKRWWLERCSYPNTERSYYPVPINAGALEGQLIHQVVEEWGKALRRGEAPGSMRTQFKIALREAIPTLKDNPRVDSGRVVAAVSLDTCVSKGYDLTRDLEPYAFNSRELSYDLKDEAYDFPAGAEELWITVDEPPLKGQLDRVRNGVVTDYKTGTSDAEHTDQLLFYAVLWWLKYNERPVRLELRYPSSVVDVPVPGVDELGTLVDGFRSEINVARTAIEQGNPQTRPSAETCRYCPVRQLCDDYWQSPETVELRLISERKASEKLNRIRFGDVELTQLPADRRSDGTVIGEAIAGGLGSVHIHIAAHFSPLATETVAKARLLGAKLTEDHGEYTITTAGGSEVFWIQHMT